MFKLSAFYHTTPPLLVGRTKRRVPKNVSRIEVDIGPGGIDPDGTKDETDVTLHLLDGGNDSFATGATDGTALPVGIITTSQARSPSSTTLGDESGGKRPRNAGRV